MNRRKLQLNLTQREKHYLIENRYLLHHLMEAYLTVGDISSLMATCYGFHRAIVDHNRFWHELWFKKKFQKPLKYKYTHQGPLDYGCLTQWYRQQNNFPAQGKVPDNLYSQLGINNLLTKGHLTGLPRSWQSPLAIGSYGWNNQCRNHWNKTAIYPLKYYQHQYDDATQYYHRYRQMTYEQTTPTKVTSMRNTVRRFKQWRTKNQREMEASQKRIAELTEKINTMETFLKAYDDETQDRQTQTLAIIHNHQ